MKILRIIFLFPLALIRLILILIYSLCIITTGLMKLKRNGFSRELQQWGMQKWGSAMLWFMGVKVDVRGNTDANQYIVMPNHRSYIDIPLIVKYHQGTLIGKAEVGKWPMARGAAKITHPILVKRQDLKSLVKTMNRIKDSINNNIPVILFPEGTTYIGPLTKPFKNGSFKIAADALIPVIPVAIHYLDKGDAWVGKDTFFGHFFRQMGKLKTRVIMEYGTPVTNKDYNILKNQVKEQINSMLSGIIRSLEN